jgi:hypothetical protein
MFLCISINFFCYYMASEPRIKTTNGVWSLSVLLFKIFSTYTASAQATINSLRWNRVQRMSATFLHLYLNHHPGQALLMWRTKIE